MEHLEATKNIKETPVTDLVSLKEHVESALDALWPPKNFYLVGKTLDMLRGLIKEQELAVEINEPPFIEEATRNTEMGKVLFLTAAKEVESPKKTCGHTDTYWVLRGGGAQSELCSACGTKVQTTYVEDE